MIERHHLLAANNMRQGKNRLMLLPFKVAAAKGPNRHHAKNLNLCLFVSYLAFAILIFLCLLSGRNESQTSAQFLFTYEINPEDDSRAPKSSLFDPSSFKIVTPSQLQSSYQKLSSQIDAGSTPASSSAPAASAAVAATDDDGSSSVPGLSSSPVSSSQVSAASSSSNDVASPEQQQQAAIESVTATAQSIAASPRSGHESHSLLKQTSAALQSFADLFSLGSPGQSSSPAPLVSSLPTVSSSSGSLNGIDQQAEARSLHEHWTREQQKSHQSLANSLANSPALNSFTTAASMAQQQQQQIHHHHQPNHHHHQQHQHQQQQQQQQQAQQQQQQQAAPASYWLTANPLNSPDGNYLVQIKQQQQQQQQDSSGSTPPTSVSMTQVVDNLLALNHPAQASQHQHQHQHQHQQQQQQQHGMVVPPPLPMIVPAQRHTHSAPKAVGPSTPVSPNLAQASFMATPTSYYPQPTSAGAQSPQHNQLAAPAGYEFGSHPPPPPPAPIVVPPTPSTLAAATTAANANALATNSISQPQPQQAPQFHHHQHHQTPRGVSINFTPNQSGDGEPPSSSLLAAVSQNLRELPPTQANAASLDTSGQLQPPANVPENFATLPLASPLASANLLAHQRAEPASLSVPQLYPHKSAEDTLISYRQQQQQQQHSEQPQPQPQPQLQAQPQLQPQAQLQPTGVLRASQANQQHQANSQHHVYQKQQHQQHQKPSDIPKVSPQIYESFLLQQRDQHEKHMELLKQQQELNKLLEQKHKQQEAESKRRRKKEELDKEARKKALREQEAARKLRLEQEDREKRRRRDEEERKRAVEEARKYREYLELRERQEREQQAAAAEAKLKRQRQLQLEREREREEQQERERAEIKLRQEREKEEEEAAAAAAAAERNRRLAAEQQQQQQRQQQLAEAAEAEKRRRQEKETALEREAKYASYLRQQEELKKLLELKQKEDELRQQKQRQVAALQQQQQQQQQPAARLSQSSRAGKLALQFKERTGAASWGAPIRARGVSSSGSSQGAQLVSTLTEPTSVSSANYSPTTPTTTPTSTTTTAASTTTQQVPSSRPERHGGRIRGHLVKKQRIGSASGSASGGAGAGSTPKPIDEKLIRQKIPLYSGPGQYGLYRGGGNDSALANDLAALLDSVTLPPSSSTTTTSTMTTTTTSTSTTPSPLEFESSTTRGSRHFDSSSLSSTASAVTPTNFISDFSSSLSPLLNGAERVSAVVVSVTPAPATSNDFVFDDDVPRRPARATRQQAPRTAQQSFTPTTSTSAAGGGGGQPMRASSSFVHANFSSAVNAGPHNSQATGRTANIGLASLPPDSDNDGIPGRAGIEYPVLSVVPQTSFSCSKQPLNGYYADTETACQVVHLCQGGVQSSILCPNGTIFNQEKFSCQWWYEVNCSRAPIFYQLNDNLYKAMPSGNRAGGGLDADSKDHQADSSQAPSSAANDLKRRNNVNNKRDLRFKQQASASSSSSNLLSAASAAKSGAASAASAAAAS